ncbi:MAG: family 78 glycoside hydrolase catalytic domain [Aestuariibaculum sp.]
MKFFKAIPIFVLLFTTCKQIDDNVISISNLKCDMATNPLSVTKQPKLSWQMVSDNFNVEQKAYQILIASDKGKLEKNNADVWDSGKVLSNQSHLVAYAGENLNNEAEYFWKVKVWNQEDKVSKWSELAFFRVAPDTKMLNPNWIGAITKAESNLPQGRHYHTASFKKERREAIVDSSAPLSRRSIMLRKPFLVDKSVKDAVVYISGLGHYELSINGEKVGNSEFAPLWTDYDKSVNLNTYKLDQNHLIKGENVIGVILGNGMYNMLEKRYAKFFVSFGPPTLFFKMKITFTDGTEQIINSDNTWKYSESPITFNSIFGGEDYNANLEQNGWNTFSFNDAKWKHAIIQEAPKGRLIPQTAPPVTIQKTYAVKEVKQLSQNTYVFNMGQNLSGFPTIRVKGKKGQKVKLWVAESLRDDGTIRQGRSGKPYYFEYTLKGEGIEQWQPKFSYYGYQYIQIDSINYKKKQNDKWPILLDITSNFIYNSAGEAGAFTCSNDIFNKAHELINNAIKSNFQAVLTDCPHREKLGWLEEAHLNGPGLIYNYNMGTFMPGIMKNIEDAQHDNGLIPTIAPEYVVFGGDFTDSPEWGVSGIILPWMYYEYYGDDSLIRNYYPVMKRYVDYLTSMATNHIVSHGLGDWYDYGEHAAGYSKNSPIALSATSHYYYAAKLLAKAAKYLNKTEDFTRYNTLVLHIKKAYNNTFFNAETKQYGTNSQFSNAVSVFMDIVEPEYKTDVIKNLLADIEAKGFRLSTGDVGNRYLFQTLARNNENEVMYKMNNHYDTPGYGFQIKFGLTTLTEQWDPRKGNSWNHFMMGQIEEWFYRSLVGIVPDSDNPGFKHFFIQPEFLTDLSYVKANYKSVYGQIVSEWEKQDGYVSLKIKIPVNTTSTVRLPILKTQELMVNGSSFSNIKVADGKTVLPLGSGSYTITFKI